MQQTSVRRNDSVCFVACMGCLSREYTDMSGHRHSYVVHPVAVNHVQGLATFSPVTRVALASHHATTGRCASMAAGEEALRKLLCEPSRR